MLRLPFFTGNWSAKFRCWDWEGGPLSQFRSNLWLKALFLCVFCSVWSSSCFCHLSYWGDPVVVGFCCMESCLEVALILWAVSKFSSGRVERNGVPSAVKPGFAQLTIGRVPCRLREYIRMVLEWWDGFWTRALKYRYSGRSLLRLYRVFEKELGLQGGIKIRVVHKAWPRSKSKRSEKHSICSTLMDQVHREGF